MYQMLRGATKFNKDLNNLDVSSVTTMYQMFYQATSFNQDLNDWDTSKVTNMQQMFQGAILSMVLLAIGMFQILYIQIKCLEMHTHLINH